MTRTKIVTLLLASAGLGLAAASPAALAQSMGNETIVAGTITQNGTNGTIKLFQNDGARKATIKQGGSGHDLYVSQAGATNLQTVEVEQSGSVASVGKIYQNSAWGQVRLIQKGGDATIIQRTRDGITGGNNIADVTTAGQAKAIADQNGADNGVIVQARAQQAGNGSGATITQTGSFNNAVWIADTSERGEVQLVQGKPQGFYDEGMGHNNYAIVTQRGFNGGKVLAEQVGQGNHLEVAQNGTNNSIDVKQNARGNMAPVTNTLLIGQSGTDNRIIGWQAGMNNSASFTQSGSSNLIDFVQYDSGAIRQLTITQGGTGNFIKAGQGGN